MTKAALLIASLALLTVQVEPVRAADLSWQDPTATVDVVEQVMDIDPGGKKGR